MGLSSGSKLVNGTKIGNIIPTYKDALSIMNIYAPKPMPVTFIKLNVGTNF